MGGLSKLNPVSMITNTVSSAAGHLGMDNIADKVDDIGEFANDIVDFSIDVYRDIFTADVSSFIEDSGDFAVDMGASREFGEKLAKGALIVGATMTAGYATGVLGTPASGSAMAATAAPTAGVSGVLAPTATETALATGGDLVGGMVADYSGVAATDGVMAAGANAASSAAGAAAMETGVQSTGHVIESGLESLTDSMITPTSEIVGKSSIDSGLIDMAGTVKPPVPEPGFMSSNWAPATMMVGGQMLSGMSAAKEAAKERERIEALEAAKSYWGLNKGGNNGVAIGVGNSLANVGDRFAASRAQRTNPRVSSQQGLIT